MGTEKWHSGIKQNFPDSKYSFSTPKLWINHPILWITLSNCGQMLNFFDIYYFRIKLTTPIYGGWFLLQHNIFRFPSSGILQPLIYAQLIHIYPQT